MWLSLLLVGLGGGHARASSTWNLRLIGLLDDRVLDLRLLLFPDLDRDLR